MPQMDAINYKIFRELQQNGRLTNEELSARVNLSPSPCLRPLRMLEQSGGLRGCTALVDQEAFGLPITGSIPTKIKHRVFGTRTPSFAVGSNESPSPSKGPWCTAPPRFLLSSMIGRRFREH